MELFSLNCFVHGDKDVSSIFINLQKFKKSIMLRLTCYLYLQNRGPHHWPNLTCGPTVQAPAPPDQAGHRRDG